MIIYQLIAKGIREITGERLQIYSKNVFASEEAAKTFIPVFIKQCCGSRFAGDFDVMSCDNMTVEIIELELKEVGKI